MRRIVDKTPRKTIVREVKLSSHFVERIVQGNVRYKSYVVQRGRLMSAQTKDNRLIRANLFEISRAWNALSSFKWKIYDKYQKVNRMNGGLLCWDSQDVSQRSSVIVMVLGLMSNNGDSIPPHIFLQGLRVNTADYIEVLPRVFLESVRERMPNTYQHSAPSDKAKTTQEWMSYTIRDHITANLWARHTLTWISWTTMYVV